MAEAESLPFDDATFDACWSVGGFNYFRDHEAALREMRRVTRPGGPVVVADEVPGLHRAGLGHLLGIPSFDAWWLRLLGLDRDFVDMVLDFGVISSRPSPGASGPKRPDTGSGTDWATVWSIRAVGCSASTESSTARDRCSQSTLP